METGDFVLSKEGREQLERLLLEVVHQRQSELKIAREEDRDFVRARLKQALDALNQLVLHGKLPDEYRYYLVKPLPRDNS